VGEQNGVDFIVMEYIEGETLAERIAAGPIPVNEAIPLLLQIAEGLEVAHEKGIIHRDLKPANIKIGPDGKPKILDFGLAKAFGADDDAAPDSSQSPTLTKGTALGAIIGTASYMSPEQARGRRVDRRADIWAFGCVFFEALTATKAFHGDTVTDTLAAIVHHEPDWNKLPGETPSSLLRLLKRCLTKDLRQRARDAWDLRVELGQLLSEPSTVGAVVEDRRSAPASSRRTMLLAIGALVLGAFGGARFFRAPRADAPTIHFAIDIAENGAQRQSSSIAMSPDGSSVVYEGGTGLMLRRLASLEPLELEGTNGAYHPVFSPDGRWLVFAQQRQLKRMSLQGGPPLPLENAVVGRVRGMTWGPDGSIIYNAGVREGLWRIAPSGAAAERITTPDSERGEQSHRFPDVLPDGGTVLFAIETEGSFDEATIAAFSLASGEQKVLVEGGTRPTYLSSGHLAWVRAGVVLVAPFDRDKLELTGPAVPLLEHVSYNSNIGEAAVRFSASGSLVYVSSRGSDERVLVWVDRNGEEQPLSHYKRAFLSARLSPDGRRVAVGVQGERSDIWILDTERQALERLTSTGNNASPIWSPDGNRIAFASDRAGGRGNIFLKQVGSTLEAEQPLPTERYQVPQSWSADGKQIVYYRTSTDNSGEIWSLSFEEELKSRLVVVSLGRDGNARLSPDGRWLAFMNGSGSLRARVSRGRTAQSNLDERR